MRDSDYITPQNTELFCNTNESLLQQPVRAIVLEFPGLGGGSCIGGSMDRTMHPSRTSATIFFNLLICNAPFYACRRHTHTILPYSIKHCI